MNGNFERVHELFSRALIPGTPPFVFRHKTRQLTIPTTERMMNARSITCYHCAQRGLWSNNKQRCFPWSDDDRLLAGKMQGFLSFALAPGFSHFLPLCRYGPEIIMWIPAPLTPIHFCDEGRSAWIISQKKRTLSTVPRAHQSRL